MIPNKTLILFFILFIFPDISLALKDCQDMWSGFHENKTIEFSLSSKKNETGHWITKFSLSSMAQHLPKNWKSDIKQSTQIVGGMEIFHCQGRIIVPPPLPADYQFFPGVGYYKYHSEDKKIFDEAYGDCAKEGGHLAIINSEAERNVIQSFAKKDLVLLGFHDRFKEGEYVTIFGEPLSTTGFTHWAPGQPDNSGGRENCGTYIGGSGLNDIPCDRKLPFICEYDLDWIE